jgi:hypothetical protein
VLPVHAEERVLVLLKEEKAHHGEKVSLYRDYERELEDLFRTGEIRVSCVWGRSSPSRAG